MVGAAETGFDIPEDGIHPVEQGQILGLTCANDRRLMHTASLGDPGETGQAIAEDNSDPC
jgi:hypothetical protein